MIIHFKRNFRKYKSSYDTWGFNTLCDESLIFPRGSNSLTTTHRSVSCPKCAKALILKHEKIIKDLNWVIENYAEVVHK